MKEPLKKVTEFVGMASGTYDEGFCFDKRTAEEMPAFEERKRTAMVEPDDDKVEFMKCIEEEDEARIFADDLLPDGVNDSGEPRPRGRWRITVEFWPEEKS